MKKLIIGNWKMNGTIGLVDEFCELFNSNLNDNIVIAMPNIFLGYAREKSKIIKLAAQDCSIYNAFGSHTAEVSASMLSSLGIEYVIIGHSERRASSQFDNIENISFKLDNALNSGLIPILCVDENYNQLIDKKTELLIEKNKNTIIIAYEPLSAIGTGVVSSLVDIQRTIEKIKQIYFGVKTLYGGSVNSSNIQDILNISEVDGVLIGGASLKASEIIKFKGL